MSDRPDALAMPAASFGHGGRMNTLEHNGLTTVAVPGHPRRQLHDPGGWPVTRA